MKTQKNKKEIFFTDSIEDINKVIEQKKTHNRYLELLRNGKFKEATELWDREVKNSFIVKELHIVF